MKKFDSEKEKQEYTDSWGKMLDVKGCVVVTSDDIVFLSCPFQESQYVDNCIAYMEDITAGEFLSQAINLKTDWWESGIYASQLVSVHKAIPFHTRIFNLLRISKPVELIPYWRDND